MQSHCKLAITGVFYSVLEMAVRTSGFKKREHTNKAQRLLKLPGSIFLVLK